MEEIRQALFELTRVSEQIAILSAYAIGGTVGQVIGDPSTNGDAVTDSEDTSAEKSKRKRDELERDDNVTRLALIEMAISTLRNCSCAPSKWAYADPRWLGFAERKESQDTHGRVVAAEKGPKLPPARFKAFFGKRENEIENIRFGQNESAKQDVKADVKNEPDETWAARPHPEMSGDTRSGEIQSNEKVAKAEADPKMSLILSPGDGLEDLYADHVGGAVSVIAGGPTSFVQPVNSDDWFRRPDQFSGSIWGPAGKTQTDKKNIKHFQRYIILVLPRGQLKDFTCGEHGRTNGALPRKCVLNTTRKVVPLCNCEQLKQFMQESLPKKVSTLRVESAGLGAALTSEVLPLRVAAIGSDLTNFQYAPLLDKAYVRRFPGSRFAAGVATLLDRFGIDLFFGVVRETTAVLLSIAAIALDGEVVAIPVEPLSEDAAKVSRCNLGVSVGKPVMYADDFVVRTEPMMLIATGITDHPILRGVRILRSGDIRTQTMTINLPSRSVRFIDHDRKISTDVLYAIDAAQNAPIERRTKNTGEVIAQFRKQLSQRLSEARLER